MAQANLIKFSAAKSLDAENTLRQSLYDADGKLLPWNKFKDIALGINKEYNLNHLAAERQACIGAGTMAAEWQNIQASKDVYPYLKYVAVNDKRTRPEHAALNGIIRPVDDDFWKTHFPPNGWNCRCTAEPLMKASSTPLDKVQRAVTKANIPAAFASNPGINGEVFTDKNGYTDKVTKTPEGVAAINQVSKQVQKQAEPVVKYDKEGYALIHEGKGGGTLLLNKDADLSSEPRLIPVGKALADMGMEVKILPTIKEFMNKNPDYKIDGRIADLKGPNKEKPGNWSEITKKSLDKAVDQFKVASLHGQAEILIVDFENQKGNSGSVNKITRVLWNALNDPEFKKGIEEVWFFADTPKGSVLSKITRAQVVKNNYDSLKSIRDAYE